MKLRHGMLLFFCVISACSKPHEHAAAQPKPTIQLTLVPQEALVPGKAVTVIAKLNDIPGRSVITDDDLEVAHTQKFHLLVIDPTLTDYQHIHPQPTKTPGIYSFTFTPKLPGSYRAWADVTTKYNGKQQFVMADLGPRPHAAINKIESHETTIDGYHFTLSFDKPPVADGESMGTIQVSDKKGNPVQTLEPVMGAFAHIAGFYDDFRTVIHIHPMGKEPTGASDRGGSGLTFHLEPQKPGFVKLFAQVKIGGKEIFVPFGVMVK